MCRFIIPITFDFSVEAVAAGSLARVEGLSANGCTAGGDEVARRRGGDGVAGESES